MHPGRHGALGSLGGVEEVPHAVQHRLEVVLLRLATHQQVHTTGPVTPTPTPTAVAVARGRHHVGEVLGGVQLHAEATTSARCQQAPPGLGASWTVGRRPALITEGGNDNAGKYKIVKLVGTKEAMNKGRHTDMQKAWYEDSITVVYSQWPIVKLSVSRR